MYLLSYSCWSGSEGSLLVTQRELPESRSVLNPLIQRCCCWNGSEVKTEYTGIRNEGWKREGILCSEMARWAVLGVAQLRHVLLLDRSVSEQGQTGYPCCLREPDRFTRTKLKHLQISTSVVITSLTDYRKFNPLRSANKEADDEWMLHLRMLKVD